VPKYNLALMPVSKDDEIIMHANQLSKLADKYLLGKESLPHVTLYQFEAEEKEVENIWKKVKMSWQGGLIELEFKEFSCISFDDIIFWVSLLPNNCENLHKLHGLIASALDKPIKKNFDPHMTLINTKNKDYEKDVDTIKKSFKPISDAFVLSLGSSDALGQLTSVIFKCEVKSKMTCKM
jgi:2'-5' RNA ligase